MARAEEPVLPPKWVLFVAVCGLLGWLIWELKEIASLIVVGYCIAYLIDPLVTYLERKKIPRGFGVILTFIVLGLILIFLIGSAIPTLVRDYDRFTSEFPKYWTSIKNTIAPYLDQARELLSQHGEETSDIGAVLGSFDLTSTNKVFVGAFKALLKGYSLTLTILNIILLPFFVYYLSVGFKLIHDKILKLIPKRSRTQFSKIMGEIDGHVSSFVRGQLLVGLILAILYAIGLGVVGIELWFLLAVIAGFGNIVPYLGFFVGIILSTLMAFSTFGDFNHILFVWLVFAIVQSLESFVITPKIIGDRVGLSPLAIIIAVIATGQIFGFLGVLLAIPITATLRVLVTHGHEWFFANSN